MAMNWRAAVPIPLRRLAAWLLPRPSRLASPNVSDVRSRQVRAGVRLDVYWLAGAIGPGPGASLLIHGDEVMRFDCLGDLGHMHINMKQTRAYAVASSARLYFRERDVAEQIERSCFELERNLAYVLTTNMSSRIRGLRLRPAELAGAVAFLRAEMHDLLNRHRAALSAVSAGAPPVGEPPGDAARESFGP